MTNNIQDAGIARAVDTKILDATSGVFFQRQLEAVKAKTYNVKYPDLSARNVFPVSNEGGAGASSIVTTTYDTTGEATIMQGADTTIPRVDLTGSETILPVIGIGVSYGYSLDEIQAAQRSDVPISQHKALAAMRAAEAKLNSLVWFGLGSMKGLFNNSAITKADVATVGGAKTFANKTPENILADVNKMFNDLFNSTLMTERGDTLLLPPAQWGLINSTPRSANSDMTIAQFLATNCPFLKSVDDIVAVNDLSADNNSTTSKDSMVAYSRDRDKVAIEVPVEMEYQPVETRGFDFVVTGRLRTAGLNVIYPKSVSIAQGI